MEEQNKWVAGCLCDWGRREMDAGNLTAGENLITISQYPWHWPWGVDHILMCHGYMSPTTRPGSVCLRWARFPGGGRRVLMAAASRCLREISSSVAA